ncbi:hypothetical protein [Candidatus Nitrosocosmicus arcticus]|uniref:Uncharacterized protein n=1 Tax=Candidatus Nitrosocosmicus arcticus TaxID=2035267 RepID=A0A557SWW2_9ARCH|nr:hypothetical protein [Candidatus Nitrosocosmicus arcticus]TVP41098.1 exported protein of unknown function [Candidatus Nitrosocosmicus arcticus]
MNSCKRTNIVFVLIAAVVTTSLLGFALPNQVMGQINDTQQQNQMDYTGFHSNIEQIIGHIEKADYNKLVNNDTLTLGHALHPIEEVLAVVTIPLSTADSNLNDTYFKDLYQLSALASPGNSTVDEFDNKSKSSIQLSNEVIATVVPATVLSTTEHNVSVIKDLLTISGSEYKEGVSGGNIILELEYQDGSAFMDRAYTLFNNTQNISNETQSITVLLSDFSNLTDHVQNLKDPAVIDQIIQKINIGLSPNDNSTTSDVSNSQTSQDYIATIRGLLNDVITAYESDDKIEAKELATTAYLDNFEYIEAPIGKELSDRGEALLREKLREQIDGNASLDEIKQNIANINKVLDDSASFLDSNPK